MGLPTMLIGLERRLAGLRRKSVQVGDHRVVYSEGGEKNKETVVLVHGFNANADSWNRLASQLTKRYHVVAPDLPGWGESTRTESASYAYTAQVERLHEFLQKLGLKRFHLAGHSMGGGISARYAAAFPDEVVSLGLLAPHGVTEPEQSELARCVARGDNWLVVSTMPAFERLMSYLFVKRPFVPRAVLKYLAQHMISGSAKTQAIFDEINANNPPLMERLEHINAPTFIVWGDSDKLIHVSAAEVFRTGIRSSEVLIMKQTGHMPLMENVRLCGAAYLAFLNRSRGAKQAAA